VFQALEDARGDIWVTGPWGIAQIHRRGLDTVPGGPASLSLKVFGSTDGMPAREASSISRAWRAPDGVLWFGTPSGVARIDPAQRQRRQSAPLTHLESVVVDGEVHERTTTVGVPPGARRLEFHFTAPDFVAPEQLRFRYRLDGFDPGWLDGGTRRVAYYTNVPPGHYVFRVQARNADGVWSSALGGVRVHLRPHFWQTEWFYMLIAAVVLAAAYLAYRMRMAVVEQSVRAELMRDLSLHDDLTGLYNRRGLLALAEQMIREAERTRIGFDVVFADLDGMKRINDTFGHLEGDHALRETAQLIRATFRESDVAARLGGDEFAILVLNDENGEGVELACGRLLEMIARHNETTVRPYVLSLSVGFAAYDPRSPRDIESLLELADREMFEQKRSKVLSRL
jgi:diguanylate cyclase (GGDEF)-like protein